MHGISGLLARTLLWRGPESWHAYLAAQQVHTYERQRRIERLLGRIDANARSAAVPVIALKGAALHAKGLYVAGERPMADIDLLVLPRDLAMVCGWLPALGYHSSGETWKHRGFDPDDCKRRAALGEHADDPIKIDVHSRLCERMPLELLELTALVFPPQAGPGLNDYPSLVALMLHVLAHAAGNMVHRGLRLIQLVDIARLAKLLAPQDWQWLLLHRDSRGGPWWALPPLALTARYFAGCVPHAVLAATARGCPPLLKRAVRHQALSDVSYSRIALDALPGIRWTRSMAELLRYVASRVSPSAQQREQLEMLARTEPWASAPEWYGESQFRRIVTWAFRRPGRIETLQAVWAAGLPDEAADRYGASP
jgi:hypothetical protein